MPSDDAVSSLDAGSVAIADNTAPVAEIVSVTAAAIPGHSVRNVSVRWSIVDPGSGPGLIAQLFQWRTDLGTWATVRLPSPTTRTVELRLPPGHTFTFRVRATDRAGHVGSFATRSIRM